MKTHPSNTRRPTHRLLERFQRQAFKIDYAALEAEAGPQASRLVRTVVANLTFIDALIASESKRPLGELDTRVLTALRMAVAELLFLDIRGHAAVYENVNLLPMGKSYLRGFVNGVLRGLLRRGEHNLQRPAAVDARTSPAELAHMTSHPAWMVEMLRREFGAEAAASVCVAGNQPEPLALRVNTLHTNRERLAEKLRQIGVGVELSRYSPDGLLVEELPSLTHPDLQELWQAGHFYFQNEAAQLAAFCLRPQAGETVVDLCSAPGGKTTHLAQLMGDKGVVHAVDAAEGKMPMLQENLRRLRINCVTPHAGDATSSQTAAFIRKADAVLLDPPCSGLGIIRKAPEVRWVQNPDNIAALAQTQLKMLRFVLPLMRSGARGVYSVCTYTRAETFDVLRAAGCQLTAPPIPSGSDAAALLRDGCVLALPGMAALDGYFIACFRKA